MVSFARVIQPHAGPQFEFLASPADIVVYGGAARGGKTYGLLLDALRHMANSEASATFFRRTYPQIRMPGGALQESIALFSLLGAKLLMSPSYRWVFPSGYEFTFQHLQHEKDVLQYQGSKLPVIYLDELTHFTEFQFWYLNSRNTGTCGILPYIRATCNPVPDDDPVGGWVNRFVSWWIDQETGLPIPERSGVVRWFYRVNETLRWYGSREEAREDNPELSEGPEAVDPRSITFIPAKLDDNPTQLASDPGYRSVLTSLPLVERERLLGGNWKIRPEAGTVFRREWFDGRFVDHCPWGEITRAVRYWDNAASDKKDSDSSAGVLIAQARSGALYVVDVVKDKFTTHTRRQAQRVTAEADRGRFKNVELWIEQEGGSGGKDSTADSLRELQAFGPRFEKPQTGKVARAGLLSAQAEQRNVYLVRGRWNAGFVDELVNFPSKGWHDDQVDGASGAASKILRPPGRPSGGSSGVIAK